MTQEQHGGPARIDEAVRVLRAGGLVAFPTETVYGLGADATNTAALDRLFAVKGRPTTHPLIVHLARAEWLDDWADEIPSAAVRLTQAFWPGPLTLILRRSARVLDAVTGGQETVGLRVPAHPVAQALLAAFGSGIAAPSANRFGRVSPTTADHVRSDLGDEVDVVLEGGASAVGIESTIVDLSGDAPRILRPGRITADDIAAAIGQAVGNRSGALVPRTPGTLEAHYAPRLPLELLERRALEERLGRGGDHAVMAFEPFDAAGIRRLVRLPRDPAIYAHRLYAALRDLDASGAARILVEAPPDDDPRWAAILDRLSRAARGAQVTRRSPR